MKGLMFYDVDIEGSNHYCNICGRKIANYKAWVYKEDGIRFLFCGDTVRCRDEFLELNELQDVEGRTDEEPKEYWRIDYDGEIEDDEYEETVGLHEDCKAIGNYFESREEAERALEKLKAWKRMKDKGISLKLDTFRGCIDYKFDSIPLKDEEIGNVIEDLDLLFGGEE